MDHNENTSPNERQTMRKAIVQFRDALARLALDAQNETHDLYAEMAARIEAREQEEREKLLRDAGN